MSSPVYTLYHSSGMGSTYTLALLELLAIPHVLKIIEFDFGPYGTGFKNDDSRAAYMEMKQHNPLAQFPTLVKSDGDEKVVLTEMAAIALCEPFPFAFDST
jgi:glutathione S-transferase